MKQEIYISYKAMNNILQKEADREFERTVRILKIAAREDYKTIEEQFEENVNMIKRRKK